MDKRIIDDTIIINFSIKNIENVNISNVYISNVIYIKDIILNEVNFSNRLEIITKDKNEATKLKNDLISIDIDLKDEFDFIIDKNKLLVKK